VTVATVCNSLVLVVRTS